MRVLTPTLAGRLAGMQVLYERCAAVISEIGADASEFFPDAAHLASWAGLCPGNHESAGKRRSGRRRHGNQHLQPALVKSA
jgi:transposase